MDTISRASWMLSSTVFIKAPVPVVTSSKMASEPEASFLDMMLEAMRGMQLTVAVTSRRAYIFLSATAMFSLWPITEMPMRFTCAKNSSWLRAVRVPGHALHLVDGAAGVAQAAAAHLGDLDPAGGCDGRDDQGGLVAHSAGGMLVHLDALDGGQVHHLAAVGHDVGQDTVERCVPRR